MRILETVHDFLPNHFAGSEIYTFHLSRELRNLGHEVHLLFTEKRPEREQFEVDSGEYEGLPYSEVIYNNQYADIQDLYDDPRMDAPICEVLDAFLPDLVHIQSLVFFGLPLVRAAAARRIPMVMTAHEYFLVCPKGLLLNLDGDLCDPIDFGQCARCLEPYPMQREKYRDREGDADRHLGGLRYFSRAAEVRKAAILAGVAPIDRFVSPSRFLAERMVREGLPAAKVKVVAHGFPRASVVQRPPRMLGDPLRFGFLGTLSEYKGVHLAVEAFSRLKPGEATFRIHGETAWFPDYTRPLMERARQIEGLVFEGRLATDRTAEFLAELDVLVVPSTWYENSPLTIREAFGQGVPVIGTDLGGMAETLEEGGGLLFPRGDADGLHACMRRLLDEPDLLRSLRTSIPKVRPIRENALELEALFQSLV
ncbi:MAG: glycosyltransferase family 4 protein [Planctomycetota bacterium]